MSIRSDRFWIRDQSKGHYDIKYKYDYSHIQ